MKQNFSPLGHRLLLTGATVGALAFGTCLWEQSGATSSAKEITQTSKARSSANAKSGDELPRQTADVWSGSPTGPEGAFEDPNREEQLRLRKVFKAMNIRKNSVVADVGAGGGWLTMRLSRHVGPKGIVYAEDIFKKFTDYIDRRAKRENARNVRTILGTTDDPKLPANTFDAVLILNAYHEFGAPVRMLRKIHSAMKPGARLGFIERDTDELRRAAREAYAKTGKIKRRVTESRDSDPLTDDHRLALDVIQREAESVGFRKVTHLELRDDHYLLVVEKTKK